MLMDTSLSHAIFGRSTSNRVIASACRASPKTPTANSVYAPAAMCIPGGLATPELMRKLSWDDLRPGSYDPQARLKDMDSEGIDVSVLFPSIGIGFVGIKDPELSAAGRRAYNNWMADFCRVAPERPTVWPRFRSMMLRSRSRRCAGWSRTTA